MHFQSTRLILLIILLTTLNSFGQEPEMADMMRSNGKIYVVVVIILVILAGIIAYLLSLDRKVSRLEKKMTEKRKQ